VAASNGVEYTLRVRFAGNTVRATVDGFTRWRNVRCRTKATRFGFYAVFFNSLFNEFEARNGRRVTGAG
jgi:hypothetical protein